MKKTLISTAIVLFMTSGAFAANTMQQELQKAKVEKSCCIKKAAAEQKTCCNAKTAKLSKAKTADSKLKTAKLGTKATCCKEKVATEAVPKVSCNKDLQKAVKTTTKTNVRPVKKIVKKQ